VTVRVLAVDTSGPQGSVALAGGDAASFILHERVPIAGGTFSAELVPQVQALLERHQLTKDSIEGFAVATGPGSFTGLRVGLAAVKALAEILHRPIAAVSLLEALALAAATDGTIAALLDAQRQEAYFGRYTIAQARATQQSESLLRWDEIPAGLSGVTLSVTCDQLLAVRFPALKLVPRPLSDSIARIGLAKLLAGEAVTVESLDVNYIRRSDAEIFSAPRR
jgi:tRNA threonylcarbamoyladenosine biosynthesis protein TsaB